MNKMEVGVQEVTKLPFKPERGEWYWYVAKGDLMVDNDFNDYYSTDYYRILSGNCFRTKEEAEAAAPEIMKEIQEFFAEEPE